MSKIKLQDLSKDDLEEVIRLCIKTPLHLLEDEDIGKKCEWLAKIDKDTLFDYVPAPPSEVNRAGEVIEHNGELFFVEDFDGDGKEFDLRHNLSEVYRDLDISQFFNSRVDGVFAADRAGHATGPVLRLNVTPCLSPEQRRQVLDKMHNDSLKSLEESIERAVKYVEGHRFQFEGLGYTAYNYDGSWTWTVTSDEDMARLGMLLERYKSGSGAYNIWVYGSQLSSHLHFEDYIHDNAIDKLTDLNEIPIKSEIDYAFLCIPHIRQELDLIR